MTSVIGKQKSLSDERKIVRHSPQNFWRAFCSVEKKIVQITTVELNAFVSIESLKDTDPLTTFVSQMC